MSTKLSTVEKAARAYMRRQSLLGYEIFPGVVSVADYAGDDETAKDVMMSDAIRSITIGFCCDRLPGYNTLTRQERTPVYDAVRTKVRRSVERFTKTASDCL